MFGRKKRNNPERLTLYTGSGEATLGNILRTGSVKTAVTRIGGTALVITGLVLGRNYYQEHFVPKLDPLYTPISSDFQPTHGDRIVEGAFNTVAFTAVAGTLLITEPLENLGRMLSSAQGSNGNKPGCNRSWNIEHNPSNSKAVRNAGKTINIVVCPIDRIFHR